MFGGHGRMVHCCGCEAADEAILDTSGEVLRLFVERTPLVVEAAGAVEDWWDLKRCLPGKSWPLQTAVVTLEQAEEHLPNSRRLIGDSCTEVQTAILRSLYA